MVRASVPVSQRSWVEALILFWQIFATNLNKLHCCFKNLNDGSKYGTLELKVVTSSLIGAALADAASVRNCNRVKLREASHIDIYYEIRHCDVSLNPPPPSPHEKRHTYLSIFS